MLAFLSLLALTNGLQQEADSMPVLEGETPSYFVYVITLPKRLKTAKNSLKAIGAAKLGDTLPAKTPADVFENTNAVGSPMNEKETACFLSHYSMYQNFLESSHEYAIVMEDDFKPTAFLSNLTATQGTQVFDDLIHDIIASKNDGLEWDLVNLGRCYDCCMDKCQKEKLSLPSYGSSLVSSPHPYCGTAYLINRKAATALSENMPVMRETDDNMLYMGVHSKIKYLSHTPRLFEQEREKFTSTLHQTPDDIECKECTENQCNHPDDTDYPDSKLF